VWGGLLKKREKKKGKKGRSGRSPPNCLGGGERGNRSPFRKPQSHLLDEEKGLVSADIPDIPGRHFCGGKRKEKTVGIPPTARGKKKKFPAPPLPPLREKKKEGGRSRSVFPTKEKGKKKKTPKARSKYVEFWKEKEREGFSLSKSTSTARKGKKGGWLSWDSSLPAIGKKGRGG